MSSIVAERVRRHAAPAAFGAGLMLFFGFLYLQEPGGTDLFGRASWVFYQTLRIGGVAMAITAAALLTGHRLTLVADAVVAVVLGVLLVGTGAVMLLDGGGMVQTVINFVCGGGFLSAALQSWREYAGLATHKGTSDSESNAAPAKTYLAVPRRISDQAQRADGGAELSACGGPPRGAPIPRAPDPAPPPEGYLATLAKKTRPGSE